MTIATTIPAGSTAVMARRVEPHNSLDFFPTPLWATRALVEHVAPWARGKIVWDPACGDGAMVRALRGYSDTVFATDVHDYSAGYPVHDFLQPYMPESMWLDPEWIVTNPPFRLAEQFIERSLVIATHGVAMLVRTSFIEGVGRFRRVFEPRPPATVAQFAERVPMLRGRLDADGSTATAYAWLVWDVLRQGRETRLAWIPPCRTQLERPGDWPAVPRETPESTQPEAVPGGVPAL